MTAPAAAPVTTAAAVRLHDAGVRFGGDAWGVRGLDLAVPEGTIVGLIGPSGCGKTTTVRLVTGAYRPDEGSVEVFGRPPHELRGADRMHVGYLPQEPVLSEDLSIWENLQFLASLSGVRARRKAWLEELLELVELSEHRRKLVRESSGGMKRRLALACTLTHRAPLLVLDEPTAGIDPILRRRFWDHFRTLRDDGRSLVVATQYVGEAIDCDRVVLLSEGRVVAEGTPPELRRLAFGGDPVDLGTERPMDGDTVTRLTALPGVVAIESTSGDRVRLVVTDVEEVLPAARSLLEERGHRILVSEAVAVDYDEVFVRLVGESDSGDADEVAS